MTRHTVCSYVVLLYFFFQFNYMLGLSIIKISLSYIVEDDPGCR